MKRANAASACRCSLHNNSDQRPHLKLLIIAPGIAATVMTEGTGSDFRIDC
jgi:hypothetical protein